MIPADPGVDDAAPKGEKLQQRRTKKTTTKRRKRIRRRIKEKKVRSKTPTMTRPWAALLLCACAAVVASVSEAVLVSSSGDGGEDLLEREEALLRYNGEVNIGEEISALFLQKEEGVKFAKTEKNHSFAERREKKGFFYFILEADSFGDFSKRRKGGREGEELN